MTTTTGTVKWFNDDKGFGFITRDDDGTDIFAYFKDIQSDGFKSLTEGREVEFEVVQDSKGLKAVAIRYI
ncbi:cold-shock protein [Pseudomonas paralactis]|uniref:Cold-shock protein n=1 Tax=Pseudomonas paralactis TaxID=1615673 RepID=A0ABS0V790_9PSED|nr:cold-shock protein [Pseudomonas paralactis]MBI6636163.1 cold-shock protein [Pseudomonas paralactis]